MLNIFLRYNTPRSQSKASPLFQHKGDDMSLEQLEKRNLDAENARPIFRHLIGNYFECNEIFHKFKNRFPYMGFVNIQICNHSFVMFCANDDLIALSYFWGGPDSYERKSLELWTSLVKNSSCVLDIGAFTGLYALAACMQGCKNVFAFEAQKRAYDRIFLNKTANCFKQLQIINRAVSDTQDEVIPFFNFRDENIIGNGASMEKKEGKEIKSEEIVKTITIDNYIQKNNIKNIDVVKIDVEESEVKVLKGMQKTLKTFHPKLFVEVTPKTIKDVCEYLSGFKYKGRVIDEKNRTLEYKTTTQCVINMLFE